MGASFPSPNEFAISRNSKMRFQHATACAQPFIPLAVPVNLIVETEQPKPARFHRYMGVISVPESALNHGPFCVKIPFASFTGTGSRYGEALLSRSNGSDCSRDRACRRCAGDSYALIRLEFAISAQESKYEKYASKGELHGSLRDCTSYQSCRARRINPSET
jgi:hypothetical protein